MGVCATCQRSSDENTMKSFWNSLPIRSFTPTKFKTHLVTAAEKGNLFDEKHYLVHMMPLLTYDNEKNTCDSLFLAARLNFSKRFSEYLLALMLLTTPNKTTAYSAFVEISKALKWNVLAEDKDDNLIIDIEYLIDIISIYVDLVTLFGLKYTKFLIEDKEKFEKEFTNIYAKSNQNKFIKEHFDTYYKDQKSVKLDSFFTNSYLYFSDDTNVRDYLYFINTSQNESKNETPK